MSNIYYALASLSFFFYLTTATLSMRLERLKSHRVKELLDTLSSSFFFYRLIIFKFDRDQPMTRLFSHLKAATLLLQLATLLFALEWAQRATLIEQLFSSLRPYDPLDLFVAALLFALYLLLILSAPSLLARIQSPLFYKLLAPFTSLICLLLSPFNAILTIFTTKTLMSNSSEEVEDLQEEEEEQEVKEGLLALIHDAESKAPLTDLTKSLLDGIVKLQERVAREIMVPRVEIFALEQNTPLAQAAKLLLEKGVTRVPVYHETIDQIEGILFAKDLLALYVLEGAKRAQDFEQITIKEHCKKAMFIPASKRVSALLQDFRKRKTHLAIIVDEYGGTEGLVTIEDILEELVGDISDEYDVEDAQITQIGEELFLIDAHMSVLDLNEQLELQIPTHGDYDSLSGFIFHKLGSIPLPGQVIHENLFDLEVVECSARSVEKVRLTKHQERDSTRISPAK